MTSDEYRAICERCGISPYRFAELCGATPGTRPSWSRGGNVWMAPPGVALALRVVEAVGDGMDYADLAKLLRDEAARLDGA